MVATQSDTATSKPENLFFNMTASIEVYRTNWYSHSMLCWAIDPGTSNSRKILFIDLETMQHTMPSKI
jgi:hypothetical protein